MIMLRSFIKEIGRSYLVSTTDHYVTAHIRNVELRLAMLDPGSSLDIMPLSTLEAEGIPRDTFFKQPVEVSSFRGNASLAFGFPNLNLTVGSLEAANRLHIIDA